MKVFLSVSGEAFAPFVQHIYSLLKESGLTVVRYEGDTYSAKPMLDCDYVIMIPPFNPNAEFIVGKGQYEELKHLSKVDRWHRTFMLTAANQRKVVESPGSYNLLGRTPLRVDEIAGSNDWKKGFAKVLTKDSDTLESIIKKIKTDTASPFTLSKFWYVAVEKHEAIINEWKRSKGKQALNGSWKYVDESGNGSTENDSSKPTITFEQFEEHVLGKKPSIQGNMFTDVTSFGDPIEGEVELIHDRHGDFLVAKMPNPNYKGISFEEMKKLLIPRR